MTYRGVVTMVTCVVLILGSQSRAATRTWSPFFGLSDWNNDLNWSPSGQPTTNDDVIIALADDLVLLTADTAFVNSLLLTNGADVATNGSTLIVDDVTETATMTIGNGVGLSRLELDSTTQKAADIDQLVINNGGQLDMDGGLIEIDTFLDANAGAEIVGRGTIELGGDGTGGRAAVLDGTIIVDPLQSMTIRSTGGGTVDLDGGTGTTTIAVLDGADFIVDAVISDPFDGQIALGEDSRIVVTKPWTLSGRLSVTGHLVDNFPLEEGTIDGGELTVTGTLEIEDQAQITINAPVNFVNTQVRVDADSSNRNPNPLLLFNGPVTWDDTSALGNGTVHFTQPVEFAGFSSFSTVVFVDGNVTGPADLIVHPDSRVAFLESAGGLRNARIRVEQRGEIWVLPQIGSFIHASSIRLENGSLLRHNGAEFNGSLGVESGEAEVFMNGDTLIGTDGDKASVITGSAGSTLRFNASTNEVTEYGTNVVLLSDIRLVHDSDVRVRPGPTIGEVDLSRALLEFAEADGSGSTLAVDGAFFTGVATMAAGIDSIAVANIQSRWRVNDSLYVGGSSSAVGGAATLNLLKMPVGGTPRLEVANELRVYNGSAVNIDGGHLSTEFMLMGTNSSLSFLDGTITVDGGTGTVPGTSLSFGTQAGKQPEFFVTNGADVAVEFAWRMATTVDGTVRTEVTGRSPVNVPSTLRNTGGGAGADLVVGQNGFAELAVSDGGTVNFSDDVVFGDQSTGIGFGEVDGVNGGVRSTLRARGGSNSVIYVGRLGSGSLDITDGALVTSAGDVSIADALDSSGQIFLGQTESPNDGGFVAELRVTDDLFVGGNGFGNLLIDTGGHAEVGDALAINNAVSRFEINGGTFLTGRLLHNAGGTARLNFGRGELTGSGSLVSSPLSVGDGTSGLMQLVVSGSASGSFGETTVESNGIFEISGQAAIAELSVATGGKLLVAGRVELGQLNSGGGTLELQGGTLAITATQFPVINNPVVVGSTSNIEVPIGSTLILGGAISGGGGSETLVKSGEGELVLRGSTSLTGPLVVESGRLLSDADSLPNSVVNNAELVFQQSATATYAGSISGVGAVIKGEAGTLTLTQNSTYTGDTVVEAGTLRIQQPFLHDFADMYLADAAVLSLDFSGIDTVAALYLNGISQPVGTYGSPESGANFESRHFTGTGFLRVTSSLAIHGDYNNDGIVNAADYTVWRDNLGAAAGTLVNDPNPGVIGAAQYATWKSNFGATLPPSASPSTATVPEPSTSILLSLFALGVSCRCHGARRR